MFHDSEAHQRPEILAMGDDLNQYYEILKGKLNGRFKHLARAFRKIDQDKSNACDGQELRDGLRRLFNLEFIPDHAMDRLVELMDQTGGHATAT